MHRPSHRTCFNWFLCQVHYLFLSCDVTFRRTSNIDLKFSSDRKSIIAIGKLFWWLITLPLESLWLVSCLNLSILCQIFLCDWLWDRGMFNSLVSSLYDNWRAAYVTHVIFLILWYLSQSVESRTKSNPAAVIPYQIEAMYNFCSYTHKSSNLHTQESMCQLKMKKTSYDISLSFWLCYTQKSQSFPKLSVSERESANTLFFIPLCVTWQLMKAHFVCVYFIM